MDCPSSVAAPVSAEVVPESLVDVGPVLLASLPETEPAVLPLDVAVSPDAPSAPVTSEPVGAPVSPPACALPRCPTHASTPAAAAITIASQRTAPALAQPIDGMNPTSASTIVHRIPLHGTRAPMTIHPRASSRSSLGLMGRTPSLGAWSWSIALAACTPQRVPPDEIDSASSSTTAEDATTEDATTEAMLSSSSSTGSADDASTGSPALPCNGHVALCDRPFDEVVFPGTHNSHSALDDGFPPVNANQQHGIAQQLIDGVRVMLIDVYPDEADPSVVLMCHGPCLLASTPHLEGLGAITQFLVDNPREVFTIIYEDHVEADLLAQDFATTGADALVFTHEPGSPWPTLGEMIDADTRLVITAETAGPPPAWLHHVWDEAWDTPYNHPSVDAMSCDLNRGSSDNALFLVNHWVNDDFGLPSMSNSEVVNATDVLLTRAQDCATQWDHAPNFLVVDFYATGDLFAVVDTLNGV